MSADAIDIEVLRNHAAESTTVSADCGCSAHSNDVPASQNASDGNEASYESLISVSLEETALSDHASIALLKDLANKTSKLKIVPRALQSE